MKKNLKLSVMLLGFVVFACIGATSVFATNNTVISNRYRLSGGVSNLKYYIGSNCDYTVSIPRAVRKWMYPGWYNPISMEKTDYIGLSRIDFFEDNDSTANYYAYTRCFEFGGIQVTPSQKDEKNWDYGEIYLNDPKLTSLNNNSKVLSVIEHEMGHVFGLRDINRPSSLMHFNGATFNEVTKDANDAINSKY